MSQIRTATLAAWGWSERSLVPTGSELAPALIGIGTRPPERSFVTAFLRMTILIGWSANWGRGRAR